MTDITYNTSILPANDEEQASHLKFASKEWFTDDTICDRFHYGQRVPGFNDAIYIEQIPKIGQGGFATVHKIYDREEKRYYAMKIPRARFLNNPLARLCFAKEALQLARCQQHRNLVKVVHYFEWFNIPCLCMEYVDGKPLYAFFAGFGRWHARGIARTTTGRVACGRRLQDYLNIFIEIAEGMGFAYRTTGLLHLDLKPSNILCSKEGVIKIIDFGLARSLHTPTAETSDVSVAAALNSTPAAETTVDSNDAMLSDRTVPASIGGSLSYMAPEQFDGFDQCTTQTDIYAVGVLMYELISGKRPFIAKCSISPIIEYRMLHKSKTISVVPGCDIRLSRIIVKCLSINKNQRYKSFSSEVNDTSADALLTDLLSLYERLTGSSYQTKHELPEETDDLQARAMVLLNSGQPAESLALARRALKLTPNHVDMMLTQANALYYLAHYDDALAIANNALELAPCKMWGLNLKGHILFSLRRYHDAVIFYQKAIEHSLETASLYGNLSRAYVQLNSLKDAQWALDQARKQGLDELDLLAPQTELYVVRKQFKNAKIMLQPHLADDWDGRVHNLFGWVLQRADNISEAIGILEKYVSLNLFSNLVWNRLGILHGEQNTYDQAIICFRKAQQLVPAGVDYVGNLMAALSEIGCMQEASELGEVWERQRGNIANAYFYDLLALAKNALGQYDEAINYFHCALKLEFNNADYAGNQIAALLEARRAGDALRFGLAWAQHTGHVPNGHYLNQMGLAYDELNQFDSAIAALKTALELNPGNPTYAGNFIISLRNSGNLGEAVRFGQAWQKQTDHVPNAHFWNQLGLALNEQGQYNQALESYNKALS